MSGHPRSLFCTDYREAARHFAKIFAETRSILFPVLLSIGLTQAAWVGVYGCQVTRNVFFYDTGSLGDAFANAGMAMLVIATVSGLMITLAIFHFKRTVKAWLALSSVVCSFVIAGSIFQDGAATLPVDASVQMAVAVAATTAYGGGAVLAFFTKHLPAWFHQLYVVTNCAAIATFYLTCLPGLTAWVLLAAIVLWDIFAVLAPIGPLKLALDRSQEYGADILRFMMFTVDADEKKDQSKSEVVAVPEEKEERAVDDGRLWAGINDDDNSGVVVSRPAKRLAGGSDDNEQIKEMLAKMLEIAEGKEAEEESEGEEEDSSSSGASGDEETDSSDSSDSSNDEDAVLTGNDAADGGETEEEKEELNAREALNSGSHLGFGDFIFYSILVGSSMAVGLLPALVSTLGVLTGLAYTLSIPAEQETLPALPLSIALGMAGHFYTVAQLKSMELLHSYLTELLV